MTAGAHPGGGKRERRRGPLLGTTGTILALLVLAAVAGAGHSSYEHLSQGTINGNGAIVATYAGASSDGTRVFFTTTEQLAATDTDAVTDLYERSGGATSHVSQGAINGNGASAVTYRGASSDGTRVFFTTVEQLAATDTDAVTDLYERSGGATSHVSQGAINGNGVNGVGYGGISSDGTRVFFETDEQLAASDTDAVNDIYERSGGATTHVSQGAINGNGANAVTFLSASSDGTRVFFTTAEQLAATDTDAVDDVYERSGGATTHVSQGAINGNGANGVSYSGISSDGTRVFFTTFEQLAASDTDASQDVYERSGGATTHVSQGAINGNGANDVTYQGTSSDGTRVFFTTAEQLAASDTDASQDVYERSGGATTHVSQGAINGNGANGVDNFGFSSDGTRVFFRTDEQLAAGDTDASLDVYERSGGATSHVSLGAINGNGANGTNYLGASSDGTRIFFQTEEQLTASDTDAVNDVYSAALASSGGAAGGGHGRDPLPPIPGDRGDSDGPGGGDGGGAGGGQDRSAPRGRLALGRDAGQSLLASGRLETTVGCDESCRGRLDLLLGAGSQARATARRRPLLGRTRFSLANGGSKTVTVRLSRRGKRLLREALRRHRSVIVTVRLRVRDASGNVGGKSRRIRVRRPRVDKPGAVPPAAVDLRPRGFADSRLNTFTPQEG